MIITGQILSHNFLTTGIETYPVRNLILTDLLAFVSREKIFYVTINFCLDFETNTADIVVNKRYIYFSDSYRTFVQKKFVNLAEFIKKTLEKHLKP